MRAPLLRRPAKAMETMDTDAPRVEIWFIGRPFGPAFLEGTGRAAVHAEARRWQLLWAARAQPGPVPGGSASLKCGTAGLPAAPLGRAGCRLFQWLSAVRWYSLQQYNTSGVAYVNTGRVDRQHARCSNRTMDKRTAQTTGRRPPAVGPFCRLPSGRVIGADYINGDPTRSVPHSMDCDCYRCLHGTPVDVDALEQSHRDMVAMLRRCCDALGSPPAYQQKVFNDARALLAKAAAL